MASSPARTSADSTHPPHRVAAVGSVRRTTSAVNVPASPSSSMLTTEPSGAMKALTPVVEATATDTPCSIARAREISSCCTGSAVPV